MLVNIDQYVDMMKTYGDSYEKDGEFWKIDSQPYFPAVFNNTDLDMSAYMRCGTDRIKSGIKGLLLAIIGNESRRDRLSKDSYSWTEKLFLNNLNYYDKNGIVKKAVDYDILTDGIMSGNLRMFRFNNNEFVDSENHYKIIKNQTNNSYDISRDNKREFISVFFDSKIDEDNMDDNVLSLILDIIENSVQMELKKQSVCMNRDLNANDYCNEIIVLNNNLNVNDAMFIFDYYKMIFECFIKSTDERNIDVAFDKFSQSIMLKYSIISEDILKDIFECAILFIDIDTQRYIDKSFDTLTKILNYKE